MPSLTERAERALLGALLVRPAQYPELPAVEAADFRSELHRVIFEHLRDVVVRGDGPVRSAVLGLGTAMPPGYLDILRQSCPDPAHGAAYARLVIEALLRRRLIVHAQRLRAAAADLHYHGRRLTAGERPGDAAENLLSSDLLTADGQGSYPPVQRLLSHELELAIALRAHAATFDPDHEPAHAGFEVAAVPDSAPLVLGVPASASIAAWHDAAGAAVGESLSREAREEQVLAGVLHQHEGARALPRWLPVTAMTGPRRELYAAITALARRGEPVDAVTADWELARRRGLAGAPHEDTGYAARIAAISVGAGTAVTLAHDLYRDHAARTDRDPAVPSRPPAPGIAHPDIGTAQREILPPPPGPPDGAAPQARM